MIDYDRPASSEEVTDILRRYEHLNISLGLLSEPSQVTQSEEASQQQEAGVGVLQLEERTEGIDEKIDVKVKQTLAEADGESEEIELSKVSEVQSEPGELSKVSEDKTVGCEDCGRKLSNNYKLKDHISRFHTETKTPMRVPEDVYSCQDCEKTFSQKNSLQAHKVKHTAGGGRVQCEVCEKMFASRGTLLTHHQTHTGKKKYACKLCEESYNGRKDLTSHEKTTHTGTETTK